MSCPVCLKNISLLDFQSQEFHVNKCLDSNDSNDEDFMPTKSYHLPVGNFNEFETNLAKVLTVDSKSFNTNFSQISCPEEAKEMIFEKINSSIKINEINQCLKQEEEIFGKILLNETINIKELYSKLKDENIKAPIKYLTKYLDSKGIFYKD